MGRGSMYSVLLSEVSFRLRKSRHDCSIRKPWKGVAILRLGSSSHAKKSSRSGGQHYRSVRRGAVKGEVVQIKSGSLDKQGTLLVNDSKLNLVHCRGALGFVGWLHYHAIESSGS